MFKVSNPFSSVPPLFEDLARSIVGEIDCSPQSLEKYSNDGSPYTIRPQAIVYPKNGTDIKHIISFSREYTIPITIRGNGTAKTGGALGEGVVIDMTRYFNHIRQINMLEGTITVDAGVSVKSLRENLHGMHMDIPLLTAQDNDSTVGALVSTKSATPTSYRYGTIREWVEGMTIIVDSGEEHRIADGITPSGRLLGIYQSIFPILTSDGPILRAVKPEINDDATGYCLWNTSIGPRQLLDQLTGGEGTLGIITSVTLRITQHKPYITTVCIPIQDTTLIPSYIEIAKHHKSDHVFIYDSVFMELADRYHLNILPPFPEAKYALCVSFFGKTKDDIAVLIKTFVRALPVEENSLFYYDSKYFIDRITDPSFLFSLLHSYTQGAHVPIPTCSGIIVPIHHYAKILEDIEKYLYSIGKSYCITGNAGSGHISLVTLFDNHSKDYKDELFEYTQTIFSYVKKYKGGISAVGGEGLLRTPYMSFIYNESALTVFNKIKKAWDPLNLLNPGKKVGADHNYLNNHLDTDNI